MRSADTHTGAIDRSTLAEPAHSFGPKPLGGWTRNPARRNPLRAFLGWEKSRAVTVATRRSFRSPTTTQNSRRSRPQRTFVVRPTSLLSLSLYLLTMGKAVAARLCIVKAAWGLSSSGSTRHRQHRPWLRVGAISFGLGMWHGLCGKSLSTSLCDLMEGARDHVPNSQGTSQGDPRRPAGDE